MENLFDLPSEYKELRASVRALAEKEIAPHAQVVDEEHRFPQEAKNALIKNGLYAAHVPAEFGGDGADALAACIIIEEVARVCASSSLIPAVNKLGSLPLMLGGNKEQKERWLTQLAKGKGFSIINGQRFDWKERDIFCVPSWAWHEHHNLSDTEDACLFQFNDLPVIESLGLFQSRELEENNGHQKI